MKSLPAVLLVVLLTGCTAGGDDSGAAATTAGDSAATSAQAATAAPPADAPTETLGRGQLSGSAVVRTADLDVRVDDVRRAAGDAARIVREAAGEVASERSDAGAGDDAELVLRVPPDRFGEVLDRLSTLGEERGRSVSTEEVGDQLVDLESRLTTQRASVARVQALLAEATNLGEVVQIEAELTRRTADLESLQARLAALQDTVQLSTVVLRLGSDDRPPAAGPGGFLDGLRSGWSALLATVTVLATVAGALLPFLPVLAVGGWLVLRSRRRRSAGQGAAA